MKYSVHNTVYLLENSVHDQADIDKAYTDVFYGMIKTFQQYMSNKLKQKEKVG